MTAPAEHQRFTARQSREGWAIYYAARPLSWNFPALTVSEYVDEPERVARDIAQILNQHWIDR